MRCVVSNFKAELVYANFDVKLKIFLQNLKILWRLHFYFFIFVINELYMINLVYKIINPYPKNEPEKSILNFLMVMDGK